MLVLRRRGRDRLQIVAEILDVAKEGIVKTQIMYRANLSFTHLNDYLSFLLKIKFLNAIENNGKTIYKPTSKGMKFLETYKLILALLGSPRLESEIKTSLL